MDSILTQMLANYELNTKQDYVNALKEIAQEIALSALAKSDFFDHAAFYGGTALRIFYGLDRFSEDLDFSLATKEDFDLTKYFNYLNDTFTKLGMTFKSELKVKSIDSNIQSAFLKGNTLEHILLIGAGEEISNHIQREELIKIKFEIDINPPDYATFEYKYRLLPSPYKVRLYDKESLFAGKLSAVLCRGWKSRVKGRDLYDFIFYISTNTKINLNHLKARLVDAGKWDISNELKIDDVKMLLENRFEEIDFENAKQDVVSFVNDISKLKLWSKEFFMSLIDML